MSDSRSVFLQDKSADKESEAISGTLSIMSEQDPRRVGLRLKALASELQIPTAEAFAEWLGIGRSRAQNWFGGESLPKPHEMVRICEMTGVTLDWIYRGLSGSLPLDKSIRLQALFDEAVEKKAQSKPGRRAAAKQARTKGEASD